MPIGDLFGLLRKRQTTPDKYLASSVNVVGAGQHGAKRPEFSQQRGINSFRSWVYAAASINANAVASMPIRLYTTKDQSRRVTSRGIDRRRKAYLMGDGNGDQRPSTAVLRKAAMYGDQMQEVLDHPILDVLASANPYLNGFDSTVLRILYGELTGNAYLHPIIDEATGIPGELWPLAPQHVEVIPDETEFIRGYVYGVDSQHKQIFDVDEVVHFRRPNPGSLYYGLGKVEAAFGVISANAALHEMDLATFQNSARPDYAVVVKGTPTGDQLDRFQTQVENRLRGTRKDGNFVTVTGDVQFTPLNFPPKDLAGREEIVEEIAAIFGVPVSMLKANDPNLASATTGFAAWREGTILPLCRMDEQEMNQSLLPLFGLDEDYCLAYDNPVPRDQAMELSERQTAVAGGWRTPNEARLEEGREPIENEFADQLLIGGQPLGGAPPMGGGLLSVDEPEASAIPEAKEEEPSVDVEFAANLLESVRGRRLAAYSAVKMLQGCGFSRAVAERMVEAETKAIDDVDLKPTEQMAALAERGLRLREEHGRGGTEVGVARARDIKNRANLSPETVSRMASFFSRHRVDLDAPAAKPGHDEYPSAGVVAWLLWGGDPANPDEAGAAWAERKVAEIEGEREKAPAKPSDPKDEGELKVYEWPKSVRKYRLGIEGLPGDFARVKAEQGEPDADEDIRDDEQTTPAMAIASIVAGGLAEVQKTLVAALEHGEIASIPAKNVKSSEDEKRRRDVEVRRILKTLAGLEGKILDDLVGSISQAAAGGGSAGISRVNELLRGAGAGKVGSPAVSEALAKAIEKRAGLIAKAVVEDTVKRFVGSLDLTFSVQDEVGRLRSLYDLSPKRAETIARTESANAYHEGQVDAWKESGAVREKRFLKAPGACQFCDAVEKKYGSKGKALAVDAPMVRGGETIVGAKGGTLTPKFDSPGIVHPNCRCDFIPVIEGI
jgi:HK97 family phage portal protein